MARRMASVAPALAFLSTGIAACGSGAPPAATSSETTTPTATATPLPTSLFPSGGIITGSPSASSSAPVLVIPQFGVQMTFSGQLGTVTYSIDSSQNGSKHDQSGTPFIVDGTIEVATARYSAMPCAATSPDEATITVFTANAGSLNLNGPTAWVTAGSKLLGFTAGQSTCALAEQNTEIPLLQQMMLSAKAV